MTAMDRNAAVFPPESRKTIGAATRKPTSAVRDPLDTKSTNETRKIKTQTGRHLGCHNWLSAMIAVMAPYLPTPVPRIYCEEALKKPMLVQSFHLVGFSKKSPRFKLIIAKANIAPEAKIRMSRFKLMTRLISSREPGPQTTAHSTKGTDK